MMLLLINVTIAVYNEVAVVDVGVDVTVVFVFVAVFVAEVGGTAESVVVV